MQYPSTNFAVNLFFIFRLSFDDRNSNGGTNYLNVCGAGVHTKYNLMHKYTDQMLMCKIYHTKSFIHISIM